MQWTLISLIEQVLTAVFGINYETMIFYTIRTVKGNNPEDTVTFMF